MSANKTNPAINSEPKATGFVAERGVRISEQTNIESLSQRGYGRTEDGVFTLAFYEALYLLDKELLEIKDENDKPLDFQALLKAFEKIDTNAWVNYLVYRDLRSRGYVVREGFGAGTDFRLYDRGTYGKDPASHMVLGTQEGKPLPVDELSKALRHCQSQKKELVLAVMNRRGEIVYYTVTQLTFK
ncbi:tRNA-intron lyase [Candidatus Bathyarchaeota archaeon]|nr:tRNA-intron lyase [Candidatus Bathyarchaeota archaeon]